LNKKYFSSTRLVFNAFLLFLAAMEALGMDLYKRNKPAKQPFAHLIIDDKNIPSGKFSFK